jgi:hypothetical protein
MRFARTLTAALAISVPVVSQAGDCGCFRSGASNQSANVVSESATIQLVPVQSAYSVPMSTMLYPQYVTTQAAPVVTQFRPKVNGTLAVSTTMTLLMTAAPQVAAEAEYPRRAFQTSWVW